MINSINNNPAFKGEVTLKYDDNALSRIGLDNEYKARKDFTHLLSSKLMENALDTFEKFTPDDSILELKLSVDAKKPILEMKHYSDKKPEIYDIDRIEIKEENFKNAAMKVIDMVVNYFHSEKE